MKTVFHLPLSRASHATPVLIDISLAELRRTVERWKRRGYERAIYQALRDLDARTLRDLGFEDHRALLSQTLLKPPR